MNNYDNKIYDSHIYRIKVNMFLIVLLIYILHVISWFDSPPRILHYIPISFAWEGVTLQAPHPQPSFPGASSLYKIRCLLSQWNQTRQTSSTYMPGPVIFFEKFKNVHG